MNYLSPKALEIEPYTPEDMAEVVRVLEKLV